MVVLVYGIICVSCADLMHPSAREMTLGSFWFASQRSSATVASVISLYRGAC